MATVMARTTWRARVGRRECRLGGVGVGTVCGAVGIIGGDDPQGHHIRRVGCCWLLLIGACWLVTRIKVMLTVPSRLAATCLKTPQRAAWLARLPEMLAE